MSDKYMVCPDCHGDGHHVLHGQAYTADELDELGPDFIEDMMDGVYDTECHTCHGQRVVLKTDLARIYDDWQEARTIAQEMGVYE